MGNSKDFQIPDIDLDFIIKSVPGYVYWKNVDSIHLGCNQNMANLIGIKHPSQIVGKSEYEMPWSIINPLVAAHNIKADRYVIESGKTIVTEEDLGITNSKGHTTIVRSEKTPLLDKNGNIVGILGVSVDISEQFMRMELEKQQSILDEKVKVLQLLGGAIAHELRTPLASINLQSSYLLSEWLPKIVKKYNKFLSHGSTETVISRVQLDTLGEILAIIKKNVKSANSFINLILGNIQNLATEPKDMEIISIRNCIENSVNQYTFTSDKDRSLINLNITDFNIKGVAQLIEHILFNLIKNAIYYVKDANKGSIYIWTEQTSEWNILHFKDTGRGVKPEYLDQLFNQFFSKRNGGTGIGLAFCKQVMLQHGGTIGCKSIENEYTHFELKFPKII